MTSLNDALEGREGPMRLYLVRHGATKLNGDTGVSVDRERGWSDVPLEPEGRTEAKAAALKLKPKGIEAIVSSDLVRAKETAQIIGGILGVKPEFSFKLRPWNLGDITGKVMTEAKPQIAAFAEKADEQVPGGESFNAFKARAFQGISDAIAKHHDQTILIVAHHRVERLLEAWQEAGEPPDHSVDLKAFMEKGDPPGGVITLEIDQAALGGDGKVPSAAPAQSTSSQKIGRDAFIYLDGNDDDFAQCEDCWLFAKDKQRCAILGPDKEIKPTMSCDMFGKGSYSAGIPIAARFTPEQVGLVDRPVRCENCEYGGSGECGLYKQLNAKLPDVFELDTAIKPHACCNAQTPKGQSMKLPLPMAMPAQMPQAPQAPMAPPQPQAPQMPEGPMPPPGPNIPAMLAHGRAIAGAKALHAVGHITSKERDKHVSKSRKMIGQSRKPFGSFAP